MFHVLVELVNGIVVRPCSNIKHETKLWFQVLTNSLEEPLVTINLTVISVLNGEHEVDPSCLKVVLLQTEVPSTNLKHMDNVARYLSTLVHQVSHIHELIFTISVLGHETFLFK
jgi:hypothetical protein